MQKKWIKTSGQQVYVYFFPLVEDSLAGANRKTSRTDALNITQKEGVVY